MIANRLIWTDSLLTDNYTVRRRRRRLASRLPRASADRGVCLRARSVGGADGLFVGGDDMAC